MTEMTVGIVYRAFVTHLIRKAGHTKTTAHTGAVTLIQHSFAGLYRASNDRLQL